MTSPNLLTLAFTHLRKGEWHLAHKICQEHEGEADFDWIHARLHKDEGDKINSAYWYRNAGRDYFSTDGDEELALMERHFSNDHNKKHL